MLVDACHPKIWKWEDYKSKISLGYITSPSLRLDYITSDSTSKKKKKMGVWRATLESSHGLESSLTQSHTITSTEVESLAPTDQARPTCLHPKYKRNGDEKIAEICWFPV